LLVDSLTAVLLHVAIGWGNTLVSFALAEHPAAEPRAVCNWLCSL
jgi:hypothetical protein